MSRHSMPSTAYTYPTHGIHIDARPKPHTPNDGLGQSGLLPNLLRLSMIAKDPSQDINDHDLLEELA